jgi:hypothetical protein
MSPNNFGASPILKPSYGRKGRKKPRATTSERKLAAFAAMTAFDKPQGVTGDFSDLTYHTQLQQLFANPILPFPFLRCISL